MNASFFRCFVFAVAGTTCFASQWKIDPNHSTAAFAVRHMMVSTVHGSFSALKGTIEYDASHPENSKADVTIDTATVDTHNENRDKDLRSENFFDVAKFPTITFVSKKITPDGEGKFKLTGDMTMHGVTREVTFMVEGPVAPVKDQRGTRRSGASATTKINRKDFGMVYSKVLDNGGAIASDEIQITVEVELVEAK